MPRRITAEEPETLLKVIRQHVGGASIEEIARNAGLKMPRRTLQRRLAGLVRSGIVRLEGAGRAVKHVVEERREPLAAQWPVSTGANDNEYIPVSEAGAEVKRLVRLPLAERQPKGYDRKFLSRYAANRTHYLTESIRSHLRKVARTPDETKPAGTYARQILNRLLIDLSWNSSRLEGNTYSLLETEKLIVFGETAEGRDAAETQMILNHKAAIEFLVGAADEIGFNRFTILNLHALLSDNLLADPSACGRLRTHPVGIHSTVYHPLEMPQLIEEYFDRILATAAKILDPFEQAFSAMVQLPYLQPSDDVNKRVSRLAANIPLIQRNLCPLSFIDVPERAYVDGLIGVYEQNRVELLRDVLVWAFERSAARYAAVRSSLGEPDPFRLRYRDQIAETVGTIVRTARTRKAASAVAKRTAASHIPAADRAKFERLIETELDSLHSGNIARYKIRPSEFERWEPARK